MAAERAQRPGPAASAPGAARGPRRRLHPASPFTRRPSSTVARPGPVRGVRRRAARHRGCCCGGLFSIARVGPAGTIEVVVAPVGSGNAVAHRAGRRRSRRHRRPARTPVPAPGRGASGARVRGRCSSGAVTARPRSSPSPAALRERGCDITMALGAATEDKLYGVPRRRGASPIASRFRHRGRLRSGSPAASRPRSTRSCRTSTWSTPAGRCRCSAAVARLAAAAAVPSLHRRRGSDGVRDRGLHDVRAAGAPAAAAHGAAGVRMVRACTEGPVFPGNAVQFDLIGKPLPTAASTLPPRRSCVTPDDRVLEPPTDEP